MNLQRLIEQYVSNQRSLGSSFRSDAAILRAFGRPAAREASIAHVSGSACGRFPGKN